MITKGDEARLGIDGVIEWRDDEGRAAPGRWPDTGLLQPICPDGRRIWFIEGEKVREERQPRPVS